MNAAPPRTAEELVEYVHRFDEELAEELAAWRCPTERLGFHLEDDWTGICGSRAVSLVEECSATEVRAADPEDVATRQSLAWGVDPGPPRTEVRPVAYDLRFGCERGHEHYVRTRSAGRPKG